MTLQLSLALDVAAVELPRRRRRPRLALVVPACCQASLFGEVRPSPMLRVPVGSLPIPPLVALVEGRHPEGPKHLLGELLARSYYRAKASGHIGPTLADRICVLGLGLHPSAVWPKLWWQTVRVDDEEAA